MLRSLDRSHDPPHPAAVRCPHCGRPAPPEVRPTAAVIPLGDRNVWYWVLAYTCSACGMPCKHSRVEPDTPGTVEVGAPAADLLDESHVLHTDDVCSILTDTTAGPGSWDGPPDTRAVPTPTP